MNSYFLSLHQSARKDGILLDTNLLLLFIVGLTNPDKIPRFKRTKKFSVKDFLVLSEMIDRFYSKIITTPYILSEVSDLLEDINDDKLIYFQKLKEFIDVAVEVYEPAKTLIESERYFDLGIADASIYTLSEQRYLVLTDDFKLGSYITYNNGFAFNFTYIIRENW